MDHMVYGKIPPQVPALEEAVLGAIMLENDRLHLVLEIITSADCFYQPANQEIFKAIKDLDHYAMPVDLLTVTEQLRKNGKLEAVGGAYYLTRLTMDVVSSAHVEAHSRLIIQAYIKRRMISVAFDTISQGYANDTDAFDILESCESSLMDISNVNTVRNYKSAPELIAEQQHRLQETDKLKGGLTGIDTGYSLLNYFTGGWQAPNLIIIAARPAIGKTAFTLNLMMHAAMAMVGVGMFSLEMAAWELMNRILSKMSGVPAKLIMNSGNMNQAERDKYSAAMDHFRRLNVHIDDTAGLSSMQLRSKARRMVQKEGVRILFIDYLQLMQGNRDQRGQNREAIVSSISRDLKNLAKDLNIPIIALSQLNRQVENRKDVKNNETKVPNLSDLRESGAIEQDADMVMFLYGASPQDIDPNGDSYDPTDMPRYADIAKNRSGSIGTVALRFNMETQTFFDRKEMFTHTYNIPDPEDNPPVRMPHESMNQSKLFIDGSIPPPDDPPF